MSTDFYSEPNIPFEAILKSKSVEIIDIHSLGECQCPYKHVVVTRNGSFMHVREVDGRTKFTRYGINNEDNVLPVIMEEFGVSFKDYCGLEYPYQ